MSDATRAVALSEAMKLAPSDAAEALRTAQAFNDFLTADTSTPPPTVVSVAGAEPKAPVKAPKAAKAVKEKPAPEKEEDTPEGRGFAALQAQEEDELTADAPSPIPATLDGVKEAVALMLSVNKRKEAIALLKKYKAASATSVPPEKFAAFIADAQAVIGPAEEGDLTA